MNPRHLSAAKGHGPAVPTCGSRRVRCEAKGRRDGFTLVEMLVVVAIIGILAAILVPVVLIARRTAKETQINLTISQLDQALETYKQKYGDYPPDFSNRLLVYSHWEKAFPKMAQEEKLLMSIVCWPYPDDTSLDPVEYHASYVDNAEALVLSLGGLSSDVEHPYTGTGGPLVVRLTQNGSVGSVQDFLNGDAFVGANPERAVGPFDFQQGLGTSLYLAQNVATKVAVPDGMIPPVTAVNLSNDEAILHGTGLVGASMAANNWPQMEFTSSQVNGFGGYLGGNDPFPVYVPSGQLEPYVYFDSRTYSFRGGVSSGYTNAAIIDSSNGWMRPHYQMYAFVEKGICRPYKAEDRDSTVNAGNLNDVTLFDLSDPFRNYFWINRRKFQIVSAGLDGIYGDQQTVVAAWWRRFPSGANWSAEDRDNLSNFGSGALGNSLP